jgi:hypothetical protein
MTQNDNTTMQLTVADRGHGHTRRNGDHQCLWQDATTRRREIARTVSLPFDLLGGLCLPFLSLSHSLHRLANQLQVFPGLPGLLERPLLQ